MDGTDARGQVRDFLVSRRARITPERAGLPTWGGNRRVAGLRREEVALLAGVSVEYYVRLERGNLAGVSESVLEAIATALQLDDAERSHLHDLARTVGTKGRKPRVLPRDRLRPPVQWLLDAMTGSAAYVRNARLDLLAANRLGAALYAPIFEMAGRPNVARFIFLDLRGREFFVEWDRVAAESTALLRTLAGENPYDRGLSELIGELSTRSDEFARLWAEHNVRQHRTGTKRFRHPIVGELTLAYESMDLTTDPGLRLNAYVAEPGSPSAEAFGLLASWATTPVVSLARIEDRATGDGGLN
ncbi:MAG TPA: helix-turn-helix transcriptional regulator [Propionicimonas sp.]|nr:helix-turn-helix transcriptional regulator [Propionicimonas sp.]HQA77372.1 helix-turn-helix transcriptional regulator [Propionicimonas sp.]HQD97144.1 helix-turn-helix transcriptional regulator [Propionicimonas sp.]